MIKNNRCCYALIVFFLCQTIQLLAEDEQTKPPLLDRLIVTINKNHYTQRELEIYFFVKNILDKKTTRTHITQENWHLFLNNFSDDFLIYQTAREVAFYEKIDLEESEFLAFFKKIQTHVTQHEDINQELIHLNPSPSELQTAFIHWKIILNFIEQRDNIHQSDFNKEEKPEWFLTLKKKNADIVFYKRAEIYEPLHPFKEP